MKFTICCSWLFYCLLISAHVKAANEQSIHLGYHILSPEQSHLQPITTKLHSIPLDCDNRCKLTWEVLGDNGLAIQSDRNDTIYMSSGIDGLHYEVTLKRNIFEGDVAQILFEISLKQNKKIYIDGRTNLTSPVLRWRVVELDNSDAREVTAGALMFEAEIGVGGCQISNDSLGFYLGPISTYELLKTKIGEPYLSSDAKQKIDIICPPGIVNNVSVSFNGSHEVMTPHVVTPDNKVGFILIEGVDNNVLKWNGTENNFSVSTNGLLSIPLTAYYTRLSNDIVPGTVDAIGQFSITYK